MNTSPITLPTEIIERVSWKFCHFLTEEGKRVDIPLDCSRVIFASKKEKSRCDTWIKALRSGIAAYTKDKNGWRKCHTKMYWVYYAMVTSE